MRPTSLFGCCMAIVLPVATPPAVAGPLAPIWTGLYVGANAGGGWGGIYESVTGMGLDASGLAGGVHAGFNLGLGPLVVGIEGDATLLSASGALTGPASTSLQLDYDWLTSLRARLGVAVGPALLYGTGGIAWGETTLTPRIGNLTGFKINETRHGFVVGAGIEARILPGVSARLEGLHYMFGKDTFDFTNKFGPGAVVSVEPSFTVVRAGVSFHLN